MSLKDYQVKKMFESLTAKERALLVLRSWKEGKDEDPAKEPVTEGEYRELEQKAREEYWPVGELAYVLTEHHEGFTEADLLPEEHGHDDHMVKPEAWERVKKERAKELAALVKDGALRGQGRGKALKVEVGAFYDRVGEPVPVHPEWAREYEVVPDEQADEAAQRRGFLERAVAAYRQRPRMLIPHLPEFSGSEEFRVDDPSTIDEVVSALKETLAERVGARWRELRAAEVVIGEVAQEFDEALHDRDAAILFTLNNQYLDSPPSIATLMAAVDPLGAKDFVLQAHTKFWRVAPRRPRADDELFRRLLPAGRFPRGGRRQVELPMSACSSHWPRVVRR